MDIHTPTQGQGSWWFGCGMHGGFHPVWLVWTTYNTLKSNQLVHHHDCKHFICFHFHAHNRLGSFPKLPNVLEFVMRNMFSI
jgi:hypothetical protein